MREREREDVYEDNQTCVGSYITTKLICNMLYDNPYESKFEDATNFHPNSKIL
jgi:hypothetical protein